MDSEVLTATSKGDSLSLASLRLVVPPLQLMTASMWQVLRKHDVMNYWKVAEFVSLVMDIVPELLIYKHRTQLNLGLRARYIIELCRSEQLVKPELILPYLDKFKSPHATPLDVEASEAEDVAVNFLELIQTLLKDPEERQNFFMEVFPAEFGSQYDCDLQTLFWEFHCRLTQLLPVPDLEQTVSWLRAECSVLEDCVHSVSEPADLKNLLQHHKKRGHLEQHVPPSSMGDSILSSLSAVLPSRGSKPTEQPSQSDPAQGISEDAHAVTFVDDVAVEIITVTDYAEVELGPSSDIEVVMGENCFEGRVANTVAEDLLVALPEEKAKEGGSGETEEEEAQEKTNVHSEVNKVDSTSSQHGIPAGPHDCPDCEKKFKFASSLIAHRVIHTGERPHRCSDCGRCFSFRQSLDRHRHTHKTGRKYDCIICGETFYSLSARTEHKQTHMKDCVYTCHQCNKKFNWELSLARHLKTHTDEHSANVPTDDPREEGQAFEIAEANFSEANVELSESDCQVQANDNCGPEGERDKSREHPTSQPQGLISESDNDVTTPGKVRTSGRKRRPTMKIQLINLQKQMTAKNRKEITRANPPPLKPLPFSCAEHSYGSPMVSSKDADDSSAADGSVDAFSCPACSFHHSEAAQVQQHIDEVHSVETTEDRSSLQALTDEEGYFSCADCEKSFRFHSLLRAHQRIHTGEQPFACPQCGRCFSFKQSLERHKQTHASGRQYECVICGEAFKSLAAQKEHKSTHMENGEYLCSECGRAFAWKSALVRHLKTHSVDADKSEESYKCPRCDLGFSCVSYLNRHLQTHQEERVHACNCGKSFAYRAALTAHQRIHQKERPHTCTQCGKGFLYKGGLLSHMKIHSEEMPFMCSFCGKSFKRERNMKKHERCHTRENVFSCSQCDKSFVYKATLIRHELTHSGERPYLCSDCGKGFFSHAELLKHERFHTGHKPFQCPHCGKKFTQSCYLTIHLRYHTGVRPYSCNECDKSFLSANRLKRHQRTHSGEKPYVCGECGKGFRQSYNLKMHQRTHVMKLP